MLKMISGVWLRLYFQYNILKRVKNGASLKLRLPDQLVLANLKVYVAPCLNVRLVELLGHGSQGHVQVLDLRTDTICAAAAQFVKSQPHCTLSDPTALNIWLVGVKMKSRRESTVCQGCLLWIRDICVIYFEIIRYMLDTHLSRDVFS